MIARRHDTAFVEADRTLCDPHASMGPELPLRESHLPSSEFQNKHGSHGSAVLREKDTLAVHEFETGAPLQQVGPTVECPESRVSYRGRLVGKTSGSITDLSPVIVKVNLHGTEVLRIQ